jgi:hypothetical protein
MPRKKTRKTTSTRKRKASARKYSPQSGKQVEEEMLEMKEGQLRSGRSGKKVTNPRQAIAIGLSKARREGETVPPNPNPRRRRRRKKS